MDGIGLLLLVALAYTGMRWRQATIERDKERAARLHLLGRVGHVSRPEVKRYAA